MKIVRPFTAQKESRHLKQQSKLLISRFKRPVSAKTHSLKQIIQVIQNTLNQGAHTILTKAKTLDKFSKLKNQTETNTYKRYKQKLPLDRQFPQFNTEFLIGNSVEFQKSIASIKSAKKIVPGCENDQFVPYLKRASIRVDEGVTKMEKVGKRLEKQSKVFRLKQKQKQLQIAVIDRWQNEASILNLSYLLQDKKFS